jgi:hypothetical protein
MTTAVSDGQEWTGVDIISPLHLVKKKKGEFVTNSLQILPLKQVRTLLKPFEIVLNALK